MLILKGLLFSYIIFIGLVRMLVSGEVPPPVNESHGQTLKYTIKFHDKPIGSIEAVKKQTGQDCYYAMTSHTSISFIKRVAIDFTSNSKYREGRLMEATSQNNVNGEQKEYARVQWTGQHYTVNMNGEHSVLQQNIHSSLNSLYFQEPVNARQVFSERFATFLTIKTIKPHTYELTLPDGRKNYYWYTNGILTQVEVNLRFGKVMFALQPTP
jgi:hypothetical protein